MKIVSTSLGGVVVIEESSVVDNRGAFTRLYCERELHPIIDGRRIVQINLSRTRSAGAVRGLHGQRGAHAEMKFVRCLRGAVWDVAVDLRRTSPTFLQWHGEELTSENARMMVIPEGCAHGFQTLHGESELLYLHTEYYAPDAEVGARVDDPRLGIEWPLPIADISERDRRHALLTNDFEGWEFPARLSSK